MRTDKFPDFAGLVSELHAENVRVILWATSMVNVENPDYDECVQNQYLVRNGKGIVRPLKWWHGSGGLLDYSNPEAVSWWHSKMNQVLDVGVDGFKCDGTDPYILEYQLTTGALGFNDQPLTYDQYSEFYYGDFFNYTRTVRGKEGLIMSRPIDCADSVDVGCIPMSPKYVMYSGWMGDDDASFQGLRSCARKVIYSAHAGYMNFGCDIGGYRGIDVSQKELFIRWFQLGAFLPLMENGGGGEHRPWMYDDETVDIYRKYVLEHYKLVPYMLTTGNQATERGISSITPLSPPDTENPLHHPEPTTFSYLLGKDLLIHPVITSKDSRNPEITSGNSTVADDDQSMNHVRMTFPDDEATEWLNYFHPNNKRMIEKGGTVVNRAVPLADYAVYVRRGALMSLQPANGNMETEGDYVTSPIVFTWFAPQVPEDAAIAVSTEVREFDGHGLTADVSLDKTGAFVGTVSAHDIYSSGFDIVGITKPSDVKIEGGVGCMHEYIAIDNTLSVRCGNIKSGVRVTAAGVNNAF